MIARTWWGATSGADAENYLAYLRDTGLRQYRAVDGNRGVYALRRIADNRAEFLLLSLWDSSAAIRTFTGGDISRAVFYPRDKDFLIDKHDYVTHYDVVFAELCDETHGAIILAE
jgi:heme-degrading monooxygenase HmoA